MKWLVILFTAVLTLPCCDSNVPIDNDNIQILKTDRHPFLPDHKRTLHIKTNYGIALQTVKLYADAGQGCNSYLYKKNNDYILIDCNGDWYKISHKGSLESLGWRWNQALPENYIGTFISSKEYEKYRLSLGNIPSVEIVYKYKDPD